MFNEHAYGKTLRKAMDSPRTKYLKNLLKFGGLWLNFGDNRISSLLALVQVFRYMYLVIGWFMIWNIFFTKGINFLLSTTAVFIPLGLNFVMTSAFIFKDMKKIEMVIKECEKNMSTYDKDWEKNMIASDTKVICQIADIMKYGLCSFGLTYIFLPIIIDSVRLALGYPEPYVVPLPLDGYLPEIKVRGLTLYLVFITSDLWFMLAVPNTVAFECLIFFLVSFATTELKILIKQLNMLQDGSKKGVLLMKDWNLKSLIKRHQQIVRLNVLQRKHLALPYICQEVIAGLSFCFTMFLINQTIGKDSVVTILGSIFIIILMATVFVMCYTGEYLEEMGDKLFTEICNLPWYRQSTRVRKDILMMLMVSSQKLVLDYGRTFSLNLRTFMQIVNTAYSYYMLMTSSS